jgi:hypothetical protein
VLEGGAWPLPGNDGRSAAHALNAFRTFALADPDVDGRNSRESVTPCSFKQLRYAANA